MKTGNRSNALLVELLIVVMFFMLAATVLMRMFGASHSLGARAEQLTQALNLAQNVAERLYAAPDAGQALVDMGFAAQGDGWTLEKDGFVIEAASEAQAREAGVWHAQTVRVLVQGEELVLLPCSRYEEAQP